jgi:ribonuclease HII
MLETRPGSIGLDEAGRGPLAGPVVAAAVMIPAGFDISGLNDSKQMSQEEREVQYDRIVAGCPHAIAMASPDEIDRMNILQASLLAMRRAAEELSEGLETPYEHAYVDGNRIPVGMDATAVVKGDALIAEIAAASILAKTFRDRLMVTYASEFPEYGFEVHFGYPTPLHMEALKAHGACGIHRLSFAPVQALLQLELF